MERIVCCGHPLGGIRHSIFRLETEFFEPTVCQKPHVLVDVICVESEDPAGQEIAIVVCLDLDRVENHLPDLGGKLGRLQIGVFVEHREDQVDAELQVQALVAHDPVHERTKVAQQVPLPE